MEIITDPKSALQARIARVREDGLPQVRQGFTILTSMEPSHREKIVAHLVDKVSGGSSISFEQLGVDFQLSTDEAASVFLAVASVTGALVDIEASAEDFIAYSGKFYDEPSKSSARFVADFVVGKRKSLKSLRDIQKLGSRVLPSFVGVDATIDIRLGFEQGKIVNHVPIAVMYIYTDSDKSNLWMQATATDLDEIIEELQKLRTQVEVAGQFKGQG